MNYRKDSGEVITAESWVMRNVSDIKRGYMEIEKDIQTEIT
jgi:hypothetical protein